VRSINFNRIESCNRSTLSKYCVTLRFPECSMRRRVKKAKEVLTLMWKNNTCCVGELLQLHNYEATKKIRQFLMERRFCENYCRKNPIWTNGCLERRQSVGWGGVGWSQEPLCLLYVTVGRFITGVYLHPVSPGSGGVEISPTQQFKQQFTLLLLLTLK